MTEIKKGDDAGDHVPKPAESTNKGASSAKQDALNYDRVEDGDKSVPIDDMNSANDE